MRNDFWLITPVHLRGKRFDDILLELGSKCGGMVHAHCACEYGGRA